MAGRIPTYRHEPLSQTKNQIRLIRLSPALHADGSIQCDLYLHLFSVVPPYKAVSYEWGSEDSLHDILVNGRRLRIRHNLWLFLETFRKIDNDHSLFWIDQICINQRSVFEKNYQVRLMGEIFSEAQLVVAWLGPSDDVCADIIEVIQRHATHWACGDLRSEPATDDHHTPCVRCFYATLVLDYNGRNDSTREESPAKKRRSRFAIIGLTYWTRLWITQELVLRPCTLGNLQQLVRSGSGMSSLLMCARTSQGSVLGLGFSDLGEIPSCLTVEDCASTLCDRQFETF